MNNYAIVVGSREWSRWYPSDEKAIKVVERWINMMRPHYVKHIAEKFPGSMAQSTEEGWHNKPVKVWIAHRPDRDGIIKFGPWRVTHEREIRVPLCDCDAYEHCRRARGAV